MKNVALTLIEWEPDGEKIDHALLKMIFNFFVENGVDLYEKDSEVPLLQETETYYCKKHGSWILQLLSPSE